MAIYRYDALDAKGNEKKGTLEASNSKEAITLVRNQGLFPTKVRLVPGSSNPTPNKPASDNNPSDGDSYLPIEMQKCKYNGIKGQLRIRGHYVEFDSFQEGTHGLQMPTHLSIGLNDIQEAKRKGFFKRTLVITAKSGQQYFFIGSISRIADIIGFEIKNINK